MRRLCREIGEAFVASSASAEAWKVEGTLGAADLVDFREKAGEAALVAGATSVVQARRSNPRFGESLPHGCWRSALQSSVGVGSRQEVSEAYRSG